MVSLIDVHGEGGIAWVTAVQIAEKFIASSRKMSEHTVHIWPYIPTCNVP